MTEPQRVTLEKPKTDPETRVPIKVVYETHPEREPVPIKVVYETHPEREPVPIKVVYETEPLPPLWKPCQPPVPCTIPTVLDKLKDLWSKATESDRDSFKQFIFLEYKEPSEPPKQLQQAKKAKRPK